MDVEHKEYASNAKGNTAVTLGSVALGLAGLNSLNGNGCGNGGILGGLLGGCKCNNGNNDVMAALALSAALKDSGGTSSPLVNRYEAGLQSRIAELETEVKLRDANIYTDGKLNALRDYVDAKFAAVNDKICAQAVHNATSDAMLGCLNNQIATLMGLTKLVVPNSSVCPGWTTTAAA